TRGSGSRKRRSRMWRFCGTYRRSWGIGGWRIFRGWWGVVGRGLSGRLRAWRWRRRGRGVRLRRSRRLCKVERVWYACMMWGRWRRWLRWLMRCIAC
ncbi:hypothetical protein LTR33_019364, partial [Friedmanniomyces endolithicus]